MGALLIEACFQCSQTHMVRSANEVLLNVDEAAEQLVDARSPGRFEGTAPEPRPGMPSGHVPGSVNVPFPVLLTKDGRCVLPWKGLGLWLGVVVRIKVKHPQRPGPRQRKRPFPGLLTN